jgi:hypothetical protein
MEALATGLPVLCAGWGYAGLITEHNVEDLMRYNLTAVRAGRAPARVMSDVETALASDPRRHRAIAEQHLSMSGAVDQIVAAHAQITPRESRVA